MKLLSASQKLLRLMAAVTAAGVVVLAIAVFWQKPESGELINNLNLEILRGVEVENQPDIFPMSALAGRVGELKYPLNQSGVAVGRVYKKNPDGSVSRVDRKDLSEDDYIFVDFYRRENIVRGIIGILENQESSMTIGLFDDDSGSRYSINLNQPFEVEDPSGLFWPGGKGITNLKVGDSVELTLDNNLTVSKTTYLAPVLGAGQGRMQMISDQPEEKVIRVDGSPLRIHVDKDTVIYDSQSTGVRFGWEKVVDGAKVFVMYYMDKGVMRAKSIGVES